MIAWTPTGNLPDDLRSLAEAIDEGRLRHDSMTWRRKIDRRDPPATEVDIFLTIYDTEPKDPDK